MRTICLQIIFFLCLLAQSMQATVAQSTDAVAPQKDALRGANPHYHRAGIPAWFDSHRLWCAQPETNGNAEYVLIDAELRTSTRLHSVSDLIDFLKIEAGGILERSIQRSSTENNQQTKVVFINKENASVTLFWFDASGNSHPYRSLEPNESYEQNTYTGHSWYALNAADNPIWYRQIRNTDSELSIVEKKILPPFPKDIRSKRSRKNYDRKSPDGEWTCELVDNNLMFRSRLEEARVFSTAHDESIRGDEQSGYTSQVVWSPNSKFAVATQVTWGEQRELTLVESSPANQLQPRIIKHRYDKPGDRLDRPTLRLIDLQNLRSIPIRMDEYPIPWSLDDLRWEPDSSGFTFVYNQRGHQSLRLIRVDAATGNATRVFEEKSSTYIDYAHKAFRSYQDESQEIIWGSERDGWYHLYLIDSLTGKIKNQITRGEWVVRSVEWIDPIKRQIWFYAGGIAPGQDPYHRHFCRVGFDGSGLVQLTQGDGDHECNFSPDKQYFVDKYSRVDLPIHYEVRASETGELIATIANESLTELQESGWQCPERFVAKGRDKTTDIYGVIFRPVGFDANKKYPIIESIYAGPQDSFVPKTFSSDNEWMQLANKGFIVVKIDGMGTSNRSKAFHDVSYKNLADGGFPDRKIWIQAAAAKYPQMDTSRIGIYGGSAGGQNALSALLFHGDFYYAGVADCGCHDNRMDKVWWNELYMGWPINRHYEANSNVVNAHRLQGKLFLMVGELDSNVDPSSTMQVVNSLIKANKDFDLLVFPGQGHGSGSSLYGKRRRDNFFLQHLGKPVELTTSVVDKTSAADPAKE